MKERRSRGAPEWHRGGCKVSDLLNPPQGENRFNRVRAILGEAAGDDPSVYGALGRFWDLPCEEFVKAKLDGVPLIAPPLAPKTCCGGGGDRRSAASRVQLGASQ
jgi:hypothetical protein